MNIRSFLILFLALFASSHVEAQEHEKIYWNYDISHGLPTNNLYHVLVDSKNRVWFGSDYGVTCYNGVEFKTYTTEDGLKNNTVLRCYEDSHGRIWFQYLFEPPSYYKDGKITSIVLPNNDTEVKSINQFSESTNGNLYIGTVIASSVHGILEIKPNGEAKNILFPEDKFKLYSLFCKGDTILYTNSDGSLYHGKSEIPLKYYFSDSKHQTVYSLKSAFLKNQVSFDAASFSRSAKYFENIDLELSLKFQNEKLYHIYRQGGRKYFSTSNGVFYFVLRNNKWVFKDHLFQGKTIISVDLDNQMNVWATSLNTGLYFLPSINYSSVSLTGNEQCLFSQQDKNRIIVGGDYLPISTYNIGFLSHIPSFGHPKGKKSEPNKGIFPLQDGYIMLYPNSLTRYFNATKEHFNYELKNAGGYSKTQLDNQNKSLLYFYGGRDLGKLDLRKNEHTITHIIKSVGRIFCIESHEEKIYFGTYDGLYMTHNNSAVTIHPEAFANTRINGLLLIENTLIIGTEDKGLWGYDIKHKQLIEFNPIALSSEIKALYKGEKTNEFWIHSNLGVQKLKLKNGALLEINRLDTKTKLKVGDIINLHEVNGNLIIITNSRFFTLNLKTAKRPKIPVFINSVKFNDDPNEILNSYKLNPEQNNLSFILDAVNHTKHPVNFYYRINKGKWVSNASSTFNFQSLRAGNYTFEFKAESPFYRLGYIGPIEINIREYWWQKQWVEFLGFILSLFLVGGIVRWRITKSQNIKRKILSNELLGLQSQMNPHFTFNSLNSIQSYLSTNDKRSAQIYLADFAKLMRQILEQAKLSLIPLHQEIDFLEQYLNLEKRRLDNSFSYEITISENVDKLKTLVPTLMLQPFVENAIWHGVAALDYPGEIKISFQKEGYNLICEITDNGLGLLASKKENPFHKSTGIANCKERMSLFKELHGKEMTFELIDNSKQNNQGVTVRLIIPSITSVKL